MEVGQHVDDICQVLAHKTEAGLFDESLEAGLDLVQAVRARGYTIADKSVVTANWPGVARMIAEDAACEGWPLVALNCS